MHRTRKALLAAAALGLAGVTPGGAWAQQQDGAPGQDGKLGTAATGGAPGATAGGGTQGGPAPDKAAPGGGTTAGQGLDAQAAKAGTAATGGAPGVAAAPGGVDLGTGIRQEDLVPVLAAHR